MNRVLCSGTFCGGDVEPGIFHRRCGDLVINESTEDDSSEVNPDSETDKVAEAA